MTRGRAAFPYLALLPAGFTKPIRHRTAGALLPHHFTLACALRPSAVYFLLHFPSLLACLPVEKLSMMRTLCPRRTSS